MQAHYHSTTYIKCYGNIIHFISSYTFPQPPLQTSVSENDAKFLGLGHGCRYSNCPACVCACIYMCACGRV